MAKWNFVAMGQAGLTGRAGPLRPVIARHPVRLTPRQAACHHLPAGFT